MRNVDLARPMRRASSVMRWANASSEPATCSAIAMQASLPDCTAMPFSMSSSVSRVLTGTIIAEVPDGAPPLRHAYSLIRTASARFTSPFFKARKTTASVMSLLMLAGGASSSALCW